MPSHTAAFKIEDLDAIAFRFNMINHVVTSHVCSNDPPPRGNGVTPLPDLLSIEDADVVKWIVLVVESQFRAFVLVRESLSHFSRSEVARRGERNLNGRKDLHSLSWSPL